LVSYIFRRLCWCCRASVMSFGNPLTYQIE
jgi:hypothetical protein